MFHDKKGGRIAAVSKFEGLNGIDKLTIEQPRCGQIWVSTTLLSSWLKLRVVIEIHSIHLVSEHTHARKFV